MPEEKVLIIDKREWDIVWDKLRRGIELQVYSLEVSSGVDGSDTQTTNTVMRLILDCRRRLERQSGVDDSQLESNV